MALTHSPSIARSGLVLYLDAANRKSYPGSGTTWTDLSGNGNNGTLTNGPTFSGVNNGVLVFDGINDYSSHILPVSRNFRNSTFSVFIRLTLLDKYFLTSTSISPGYYQWYVWGDGRLQFEWSRSTGALSTKASTSAVGSVTTNTWYNLVFTLSDSDSGIYRNGVRLTTTSGSDGDLTISAINIPGTSAGANIGLVTIYDRALTPTEIRQNFEAHRDRYGI